MTASSSHLPDLNPIDDPVSNLEAEVVTTEAIDTNVRATKSDLIPNPGGALTTTRGSFASFLAPLTKETFRQVILDVEQKLRVVNQTLSMLNQQGFETILEEMLSSITFKTAELLNADRASIFLLDEEKHELYSIVAQGEGDGTLEIRIPINQGIAGEAATLKQPINIPFDFYDDPRSAFAKKKDQETGYRTYTMLTLPLLNDQNDLVAVVQLINKLQPDSDHSVPLEQRIDLSGFTEEDERVFQEFTPSIRLILESSRSFYIATQRQRATSALIAATESLSKSSLDLDDTLKRVMDEAKKLMNADRSTLWLIDHDRNQIWTKIANQDGSLREVCLPIGEGFAGHVAATGAVLNIPFDLYEHPDSETAKKTDEQTGYRTCSLLCMPVLNVDGELIGVTQLVNKVKPGEPCEYNPATWPEAPECWRAGFNRTDQEFMETFNIQAGVALQNAKLFATVKQQEQLQRDILRSLSNGVISTDQQGRIMAANESAREILGLDNQDFLEGRFVEDLIQIEKGDFSKWFTAALEAQDEKNRQQYYPDQTLQSVRSNEQHSVNLSINTIADANDSQRVSGVLVVMDDISDEKRLKNAFYRYMTQEVAEEVLNSGRAKLGGDRKEVTILFSDIRGYTSLIENMQAEEVVTMLNAYFEAMVDAVFAHKGTLDKYIGDAIMAVFGSPLPLNDHAWLAVQTAIAMRHQLTKFNAKPSKFPQIKIGIGINSDSVISGNIGSSKRMEYTAIGDGVNLGARLESASKLYGCDILISESTYQPCADRVWVRELDYIRVKGKTKPVGIYELVGLKSEPISEQKKESIELYHKGREHYLNRKFSRAISEFAIILEEIDSNDKAAALYINRCQHWLQHPPMDDETWQDGVWTLTEK
jgi:adenylate cyclase